MRRIFVTGAGGFVGQHLINLLEDDYLILGLLAKTDNLSQFSKKITYFESSRNKVLPKAGSYIKGDILDKKLLIKILHKYQPEAIIHLAAIATSWFKDVSEVFRVNLLGTMNLYESVLGVKKTKKHYNPKILYISSSEVYGKTEKPNDITEKAPLFPANYYAASKVAADRLSYAYSQNQKLNIVIIRPFTHTGPGQGKGFFVPDMASQIAELEKDPTKNELFVGNLEAVRDYLDVRDVVRAYKLIMEKDFPSGETFNICSGKGRKMKDILKILLRLANKKIVIKTDPSRMRPSDVPIFVGNHDKLTKLTGWKPEKDFTTTLKETLDYWRGQVVRY